MGGWGVVLNDGMARLPLPVQASAPAAEICPCQRRVLFIPRLQHSCKRHSYAHVSHVHSICFSCSCWVFVQLEISSQEAPTVWSIELYYVEMHCIGATLDGLQNCSGSPMTMSKIPRSFQIHGHWHTMQVIVIQININLAYIYVFGLSANLNKLVIQFF